MSCLQNIFIMEFYKQTVIENDYEWSFSYNSFVKWSLYKSLITLSVPMAPKHSVIKGLHYDTYFILDIEGPGS